MGCCDKNEKINNEVNSELDGLICYCFKHSKKSLFDAIKSGKEKDIVDDIKKKMKDPGCFCESSNPSGKCCMTDVIDFVKRIKNENGRPI